MTNRKSTHTDRTGKTRHERIVIGYEFDGSTSIGVALSCDTQASRVIVSLGDTPIEIELVTDSPSALGGLAVALETAARVLEEHIIRHATETHPSHEPLFVPDDWTRPTNEPDGPDEASANGGSDPT